MASLPLFPLSTVLFPGADLPLQIFEPRYVRLLRDLREHEPTEREFGVVALRRGVEVGLQASLDVHEIGCTASLLDVRATPAGDRFLVQTRGARRFRLVGLDPSPGTPYHRGLVEWLPEVPGGGVEDLTRLAFSVRTGLAAYARLGRPVAELPSSATTLGYAAADAIALDLADRQQVLAAPTTAARLRLVARLIERETLLLDRLAALPGPIRLSPPSVN